MKRLPVTEIGKYWARVPNQFIWKNLTTGEFIAVHGSPDSAAYVVKKTTPTPDPTWVSGTVITKNISPYFVLRSKPIGDFGREKNASIRENENWQYGTLDNALSVARDYMSTHYSDQPKTKQAWKNWRL